MTSSSTAVDGVDDPLVGEILDGKYRIRKLIGRGGVGLVYLATHVTETAGGRDVVAKVLHPRWAQDPETLARFEREARRLATLRHPNIVRMFDHGRHGNSPYLVMEYCKGELLSDYVERNRSLTLQQFVPIAAQILKGIGHCHSRDMMVRDIKPANVMLVQRKGRANFVKVLDFGLAKLLKDDQSVTQEHVMGTVGYLSPEQIRGEDLDLRVDVYAVGVLFYFMIGGRLPFEGNTNATVFYKTVNDPPADLRGFIPDPSAVPEGLIELIEDCLQKDRTLRPANADAIVERLIDVVPAALFRLPRADTARHGVASNAVPPGHGNTGMMELLGTEQSPSKPISTAGSTADSGPPNVQEAGTGRTKVPAAVPVTNPSPETLGERPKTGTSTWVVVAAVLAALGLVAWFGGDWDGDSTDDASAVGSPPSVAGAPKGEAVLRALQAASAHINAGELDQAEAQLDGITALATASASARAQHTKLERQLKLRRLMRAGARFEAGEQAQAALDTYRDALAIDPAFVAARVAVTRLEEANAAPDHADHEVAHAAISSAPRGTLLIDGKKTGKTPYNDSLSVGVHRVEIRARGYTTWKGELEVKADGAAPLAVVLSRRGAGRDPTKRPRPDSRPEAATTPEPSKPEPSKPEPSKPEPASKPDPATKPGPFLPTKAKDKDSVFLPTKD